MSATLRRPRMTRDEFLDWVATQEGRWEFDGFEPVAMTGGTRTHSRLGRNILLALGNRLRGAPCEALGPDAGVVTVGDTVRYPDALVTCTAGPGADRTIPGVVAVFEVLSATSGRNDRIVKLREYRAVASIRRYVILDYADRALTVFGRAEGADTWTAASLTGEDVLRMPEIGVEVPVAEFYEGVAFDEDAPA